MDEYASAEEETVGTIGLLFVIEVLGEDMEFARKMGGQRLLDLLQKNGHYSYSDLERESVVREIEPLATRAVLSNAAFSGFTY